MRPAEDQAPVEEGDEVEPEPHEPAVLLLGTAHVVPLRKAIQNRIFEFEADVVALELDQARLQGLLTPPEERERGGLIYGMLARFQERVADDLGGSVGDEMLAGREAAMLMGIPVALVDRPADQTFRRLFKQMGWWERLKLMGSVVASFLPGQGIEEDLQRALDGDPTLIEEVAKQFPTVKRVLIDERDEIMAKRCARLANDHGHVVGIVGDAHVPGMTAHLEGLVEDVRSVRVKDLTEEGEGGSTAQAGFSVELEPGGDDVGPEA